MITDYWEFYQCMTIRKTPVQDINVLAYGEIFWCLIALISHFSWWWRDIGYCCTLKCTAWTEVQTDFFTHVARINCLTAHNGFCLFTTIWTVCISHLKNYDSTWINTEHSKKMWEGGSGFLWRYSQFTLLRNTHTVTVDLEL